MPNRFDAFVRHENLKNFRKQIKIETDAARLLQLKTLLREEEERQALPAKHKHK